jgi:hypothetical protein
MMDTEQSAMCNPRNWREKKKAAPVSQNRGSKVTQNSTMRPKLGFNTTQRWSQRIKKIETKAED